jgi:dihydrofolate reductase
MASFGNYWPSVADNPDVRPVEREISRLNNAIEKMVISDSLTPEETAPWDNNTRIVKRSDVHNEITKLKRQDGKEILIFGSRTLWNDLLVDGLVDELHLMIGQALLSNDTSGFEGSSPVKLHLLDSRTLENSQLILARYSTYR